MKNQQEAVLAALLNTAVDTIIIMDSSGTVRIVNATLKRMFGYEESDVIGQNVRMLMPSPYREHHDHYLAKYRSEGKRNIIGIGREVSGQRKDGTVFPLHLAVSELEYDGEVLFTGILRDITDLKRVQSQLAIANAELEQHVQERTGQLRQAQAELVKQEKLAAIGQVAGGIAHEISNPLNALKTSAYFLQHAKNLSPEKLLEHLQRIDRQVMVIDSVISALTAVVRMPAPRSTPCELKSMLADATSASSLDPAIEVIAEIPTDLPPVWVDRDQMLIVFQNLIRNARDAMPEGGRLIFHAAPLDEAKAKVDVHPTTLRRVNGPPNSHIVVSMSDTGTGIAPERISQIMEPFVSTKARGMGLGLAITKTIVEKNQGSIAVESELGRGTTFRIVLPTVPNTPDEPHSCSCIE